MRIGATEEADFPQGWERVAVGRGPHPHNSHPSNPLTALKQVENRVATALSQVLVGVGGWGLPRARGVSGNPCTLSFVKIISHPQGEDQG